MHRIARMLAVMASAGVAFAAGSACAGEVKVTVVKASGLDGIKVVRDKESGKLRAATPAEIVEMNKQSSGFAPNAVVVSRPATTFVTRADGGMTVRRSIEDIDSLKVERGANGKLHAHHGDKPAAQPLPKE